MEPNLRRFGLQLPVMNWTALCWALLRKKKTIALARAVGSPAIPFSTEMERRNKCYVEVGGVKSHSSNTRTKAGSRNLCVRGMSSKMVGAAEETQLKRLELEVENGGGGAWDYLCLVRKLKVRRSHNVLKYGLPIVKDPNLRSKLGNDEWTLYEQVAIAAMDCQHFDVAKDCLRSLRSKFPGSTRVARLEGMLLEAKGSWAEAEKAYAHLLKDNPLDQVIHKRKVAMAQAQGNVSSAIECLNKYLEIFMADHDAWRELAEMYVTLQMYKQAAFCYEELILFQPTVPLHHLAYAEASGKGQPLDRCLKVLYTLGGLENLQMAKKYYASTIDLTGGKNSRALFEPTIVLMSASCNLLSVVLPSVSWQEGGRPQSYHLLLQQP
ncbi:hypothetical protein MRB53_018377 [Persea americana]|uniref:Uncharacterized protein n=1 Tax=Persea americana TaxID=3435 RepID=A0ACC2M897_PERAE|nr:hypothetical protein MRB53_018377 [Persea americana]